jgi:hypothetical protein
LRPERTLGDVADAADFRPLRWPLDYLKLSAFAAARALALNPPVLGRDAACCEDSTPGLAHHRSTFPHREQTRASITRHQR